MSRPFVPGFHRKAFVHAWTMCLLRSDWGEEYPPPLVLALFPSLPLLTGPTLPPSLPKSLWSSICFMCFFLASIGEEDRTPPDDHAVLAWFRYERHTPFGCSFDAGNKPSNQNDLGSTLCALNLTTNVCRRKPACVSEKCCKYRFVQKDTEFWSVACTNGRVNWLKLFRVASFQGLRPAWGTSRR